MKRPQRTRKWKCPTCGDWHDQPNGAWLKWLRGRLKQTLREVATKAQVSYTYVWDIETGKRRCNHRVAAIYSNMERRLQQDGVKTR